MQVAYIAAKLITAEIYRVPLNPEPDIAAPPQRETC
jgi:hypothetical protein